MKKDKDGNFIDSPLDGAPNGNQKGARTDSSNPKHTDFRDSPTPVHSAKDMVGPDYTGMAGISTSQVPLTPRPDQVLASVDKSSLPKGLSTINDHGDHVSVYPSENMTFGEFQTKVNSIPWK
ncbi:hypothetical protein [Acinetobacter sichuanensis]|uniref:hypothetical protein n=1 Tax=Acinetobacter sichuanensis TaxID=2136183 RepID=UPI00148CD9B7|nr:hypothetical protein [Acinetobacter sichuanensis]